MANRSLLFVALAVISSFLFVPANSTTCHKRQDVALVYELPHDDPNRFRGFSDGLNQFAWYLGLVNHDCIRLGVILAWKKADVMIKLDCTYGNAQCFKLALNDIREMERSGRESGTVPRYEKKHLANAMEIGRAMLSFENKNARDGVEKSMILVLSNPPEADVLATEDAAKHLHDSQISLYVVAIGEGRKEHLRHIATDDAHIFKASSLNNAGKALELVSNFVKGKYVSAPVAIGAPLATEVEFREVTGKLAEDSLGLDLDNVNRVILDLDAKEEICERVLDIGFILDSSGSMEKHYSKEKFFAQRIISKIKLEKGSRASAIIFSSGSYVTLEIPFNKHSNSTSFNANIRKLPLYKYQTRIDKALSLADKSMFTEENGARPNVKKVLILITDGEQTPRAGKYDGREKVLAPEVVANALHERNISIYAIGVGGVVNKTQLELITKKPERAFVVKNFDQLLEDGFVRNITQFACQKAELKTAKPSVITFPESIKARTTSKPSPAPKTTTTSVPTTFTSEKTRCKCNNCQNCECDDGCKCKRGCGEKPAVYVNIFNGNNGNNVVMQNSKLLQNIQSDPALWKKAQETIHPKLAAGSNFKNKTTIDIQKFLKAFLPYRAKVNDAVAELIRRSLQNRKKRST